jgi:hypothetical protein
MSTNTEQITTGQGTNSGDILIWASGLSNHLNLKSGATSRRVPRQHSGCVVEVSATINTLPLLLAVLIIRHAVGTGKTSVTLSDSSFTVTRSYRLFTDIDAAPKSSNGSAKTTDLRNHRNWSISTALWTMTSILCFAPSFSNLPLRQTATRSIV